MKWRLVACCMALCGCVVSPSSPESSARPSDTSSPPSPIVNGTDDRIFPARPTPPVWENPTSPHPGFQTQDEAQLSLARQALEEMGALGLSDDEVRLRDVVDPIFRDAARKYRDGDTNWSAALRDAEAASKDRRIMVELRGDPEDLAGSKLVDIVPELGAELVGEVETYVCEAIVPIDTLDTIARDSRIAGIRQILRAEATEDRYEPERYPLAGIGSLAEITNAPWWNTIGNTRGENMTIVIVDNFLPAPREHAADAVVVTRQAQLNLSRLSNTRDASHGWSMESQIRELAPNARVIRIERAESRSSTLAALEAAGRYPSAIVNLSFGYKIDRSFGTGDPMGPIQRALDRLRADAVVVASAGNDSAQHWSGNFVCSNQAPTDPSFPGDGTCLLNWGQFSPVADYPHRPTNGRLSVEGQGLISDGFREDLPVNPIGCVQHLSKPPSANERALFLGALIGMSTSQAANFTVVLMRREGNAWIPVRAAREPMSSAVGIYLSEAEAPPPPIAAWRIPATGIRSGCASVGTYQYGIALLRRRASTSGTAYVNMFSTGDGVPLPLEVFTSLASLRESNTVPGVLTVGGTLCTGDRMRCTAVGAPETTYGFGPPVVYGQRPTYVADGVSPPSPGVITETPALSAMARDPLRGGDVKPDFLAPAALGGGTSQATAVTSALLALLWQRYPALSNIQLMSAAHRIAERRRTNYPSYTDSRTGLIEGLTTTTYGRGVFTLEKEAGTAIRGLINDVRVNQFLTSSPSTAPRNGSMRYPLAGGWDNLADPRTGWGFGRAPVLYFSSTAFTSTRAGSFDEERARYSDRVRFPVLTPYVRFEGRLSAPSGGARIEDFAGGELFTQWSPSISPPSRNGGIDGFFGVAWAPRAGTFLFDRMRITRMPNLPNGQSATVALNYALVLASKRSDGTVVRTQDVPEHSIEINLCDASVADSRCPMLEAH